MERMVSDMKRWVLDGLWAVYLGGALAAVANLAVFDWQFWAIMIPTAILVTLRGTL